MFSLPDKDTITLLRIPFSFYLMPVFILALSQSPSPDIFKTIVVFLIVHVLVYPASNGYNSFVDQDETSIGGLEKPPKPGLALFHLTLVMDFLAVILSCVLIGWLFSLCIILYILASRAYSSRQIRLKRLPYTGFLIVVVFQGAFTFLMVSIGISDLDFDFNRSAFYILTACSLQIAGAYPLTQIYQHEADLASGVRTLSYKLGYTGTFVFTISMFALCNIFYFLYFNNSHQIRQFYILQVCFIPVIVYFISWFLKVKMNTQEASFRNTMKMNWIAAVSMNVCFVVLCMIRLIQ